MESFVGNSHTDVPYETVSSERDASEVVRRERRWFCCDCRGKMTLVEGKRCALHAFRSRGSEDLKSSVPLCAELRSIARSALQTAAARSATCALTPQVKQPRQDQGLLSTKKLRHPWCV
eukprot:625654-Prorocentrum_minimum.AAC.4